MVTKKFIPQGPGFLASGYDDGGARRADVEPGAESDPFDHTVVYRLRRDALHLTCKLNAGWTLSNEGIRVQLVFIQSLLCAAALADPALTEVDKAALLGFHANTVTESLENRRASKDRSRVGQKTDPALKTALGFAADENGLTA